SANRRDAFSVVNSVTPNRQFSFPVPTSHRMVTSTQPRSYYGHPPSNPNETIISNQSEQFHASTSESLTHCSNKILCHYNRLVTVIGWRPLVNPRSTNSGLNCVISTINIAYLIMILLLLLTG